MLFKPNKKELDENKKEEPLLIQEVVNDQPKKIKKEELEKNCYFLEPDKFTD
jgi:hypothetical protein